MARHICEAEGGGTAQGNRRGTDTRSCDGRGSGERAWLARSARLRCTVRLHTSARRAPTLKRIVAPDVISCTQYSVSPVSAAAVIVALVALRPSSLAAPSSQPRRRPSMRYDITIIGSDSSSTASKSADRRRRRSRTMTSLLRCAASV